VDRQTLRHCPHAVDPNVGQFSRNLFHDVASNGVGALRYVVVTMQTARRAKYVERACRIDTVLNNAGIPAAQVQSTSHRRALSEFASAGSNMRRSNDYPRSRGFAYLIALS
jgi:hypothetical protein